MENANRAQWSMQSGSGSVAVSVSDSDSDSGKWASWQRQMRLHLQLPFQGQAKCVCVCGWMWRGVGVALPARAAQLVFVNTRIVNFDGTRQGWLCSAIAENKQEVNADRQGAREVGVGVDEKKKHKTKEKTERTSENCANF